MNERDWGHMTKECDKKEGSSCDNNIFLSLFARGYKNG